MLTSFRELHRVGAVDLRIMADGVGIERTAEWCLKTADRCVRELTNNRCWVKQVEVWEHEKNSAIALKSTHACKHQSTDNTRHEAIQLELDMEIPTQPYATAVTAPAPELLQPLIDDKVNVIPVQSNNRSPKPAAVGNKVTSGFGNPFAGTSWGT